MYRPRRRQFLRGSLALASLGLLSACGFRVPWAQQPPNVRRIGILGEGPSSGQWDAFHDRLRELGYVEGQNISIDYRWAEGDYGRFADLTGELVGLNVECIVTSGLTASVLAKPANTTIPMVAAYGNFDAVETGLVNNIARPEGNITGTAGLPRFTFWSKVLEQLKDAVPNAGQVAVLAHAQQPSINVTLDSVKSAAGSLGLQLEIGMVENPAGIQPAFSGFSAADARALMIIHTAIFGTARAQIASLALTHRLPAISPDTDFPRAGGLMAYSGNRAENYRRAATYVDKILKGAKPSELPMERPTTFDFVINLTTAKAFGLTIPQSVLVQATELIQ